jgi:hypothetical protein
MNFGPSRRKSTIGHVQRDPRILHGSGDRPFSLEYLIRDVAAMANAEGVFSVRQRFRVLKVGSSRRFVIKPGVLLFPGFYHSIKVDFLSLADPGLQCRTDDHRSSE